jgi:hypothetical protein
MAGLAGLLLLAGVLWGCTQELQLLLPETGRPVLPPEVDSIVLVPLQAGEGVAINAADLTMLDQALRGALDERPGLRTYDTAPTKLPNTVRLQGALSQFALDEREDAAYYLRMIRLAAQIDLAPSDAPPDEVQLSLPFSYTYQRIYPGGSQVPALPFDLRNAMTELSQVIAQKLSPLAEDAPFEPFSAVEADTGADEEEHPLLAEANALARKDRLERAQRLWLLVLYDPSQPGDEALYRLSERSLRVLAAGGMPEGVLSLLRERMLGRAPVPLLDFRSAMRDVIGPDTPHEGAILTAAVYAEDRMRRTAAASHANLAAWYERERRLDLAAYHWAMANANDTRPVFVERWAALQRERNVLPGRLSTAEALALYHRVPAPPGARVQPGSFDLAVLPATASAAAGAAPRMPAATGNSALVPVSLPPPVETR